MKTIVNTENVKYSVTCKNDNESILNVDIFMAAEFIKIKNWWLYTTNYA